MYYTVYKITNKINGKFYIGKHQTENLDDGYMGSGKLIKRAVEKYGVDSFVKDILFVFNTETEMNTKEAELVVLGEGSYNLCPGGRGGFGYINSNSLSGSALGVAKKAELFENPEWKANFTKKQREGYAKMSEIDKQTRLENWRKSVKENDSLKTRTFQGRKHTDESKRKMSETKKQKAQRCRGLLISY